MDVHVRLCLLPHPLSCRRQGSWVLWGNSLREQKERNWQRLDAAVLLCIRLRMNPMPLSFSQLRQRMDHNIRH